MIYGALPDRGQWRAADRIKEIDPNIRKLMAFLFKQRLNDHLNGNLRAIFNGGKILVPGLKVHPRIHQRISREHPIATAQDKRGIGPPG